MALTSTTVWDIQSSGSDSNGGNFDPSNANMAVDLTCTVGTSNAPVVASASYNFVSGDVGSWLFIKSGTNWIAGWYKIASVAANAATLTAGIGTGYNLLYIANTVIGCSTVATQSANKATWTIDYSQSTLTTANTLTGLTSAGAGLVVLCSTANKAMVGNGIQITGGTNFNTGIYNISSVSIGTSLTLIGPSNSDSGVGAAGTANVGGCLANLGKALGIGQSSNIYYLKLGSYTQSSNPTTNAVGVTPNNTTFPNLISGYNILHGDNPTGSNCPTITATTGCTIIIPITTTGWWAKNLILDAGTTIANTCISANAGSNNQSYTSIINVLCKNFKVSGIDITLGGFSTVSFCEVTGGTSAATAAINVGNNLNPSCVHNCNVHDNLCTGILVSQPASAVINCLITNNTGTTSDGIQSYQGTYLIGNTISGSGRDAIRNVSQFGVSFNSSVLWRGNILVNSVGYGMNFTIGTNPADYTYDGNIYYNNTLGNRNGIGVGVQDIILTVSPFISTTNFGLNTKNPGGGQLIGTATPGSFPGSTNTIGFNSFGAVIPKIINIRKVEFSSGGFDS